MRTHGSSQYLPHDSTMRGCGRPELSELFDFAKELDALHSLAVTLAVLDAFDTLDGLDMLHDINSCSIDDV